MVNLILLRHGQSLWNLENRFTGWTDVDLSAEGIKEAHAAGQLLQQNGYEFDIAYTSVLTRAIHTLWIVLDELQQAWIPVERKWALNERHYGALQGLNKAKTAVKYGEDQVHLWRRSFAVRPPALNKNDPRHPRFDRRYAHLSSEPPATESLADTLQRVISCWESDIFPKLKQGMHILIAAHGNSLRALVKHLDQISDEQISELNIPTGIPLVYEFNTDWQCEKHYYLGDARAAEEAARKVATQASPVKKTVSNE